MMNDASSEARNRIARATSIYCPKRPIGWCASSHLCSPDHCAISAGSSPSSGVSIVPGETAFTLNAARGKFDRQLSGHLEQAAL